MQCESTSLADGTCASRSSRVLLFSLPFLLQEEDDEDMMAQRAAEMQAAAQAEADKTERKVCSMVQSAIVVGVS